MSDMTDHAQPLAPNRTDDNDRSRPKPPVILLTGMSGAGKTSALKALEDLGYEAVDNIPLSFLKAMINADGDHGQMTLDGMERPIAIVIDIRTRGFEATSFQDLVRQLKENEKDRIHLVFMDCDNEVLKRRYDETRHRHPLAVDRPVTDGIVAERRLLHSLREQSDLIIDSSALAPGELKGILDGHFGTASKSALSVFVTSFSFKKGLPRQADLVFDVRFLTNPHYDPALKELTGRDKAVQDFIAKDGDFDLFFDGLTGLLEPLLPRYAREGKSYLTIAVGCTGGKHRSVFVAEKLAGWLNDHGETTRLSHRELTA